MKQNIFIVEKVNSCHSATLHAQEKQGYTMGIYYGDILLGFKKKMDFLQDGVIAFRKCFDFNILKHF